MTPYETAPANLRSLRDRLTVIATREGAVFGRLQRHLGVLAVTQIYRGLEHVDGSPALFIKGGMAIEIRQGLRESRASRDLDTVSRIATNDVHDLLTAEGKRGWQGFTAEFTRPMVFRIPTLPSQAFRFTAKVSYHGQSFVSIPIEVTPVELHEDDAFDLLASDAFPLVGVGSPAPIPCLSLPWQIAQKIHALTSPGATSSDREADLVDLQLLEALVEETQLAEVRLACESVFLRRQTHEWPPRISMHAHWEKTYPEVVREVLALNLPVDVYEAVRTVQAFVLRIAYGANVDVEQAVHKPED